MLHGVQRELFPACLNRSERSHDVTCVPFCLLAPALDWLTPNRGRVWCPPFPCVPLAGLCAPFLCMCLFGHFSRYTATLWRWGIFSRDASTLSVLGSVRPLDHWISCICLPCDFKYSVLFQYHHSFEFRHVLKVFGFSLSFHLSGVGPHRN